MGAVKTLRNGGGYDATETVRLDVGGGERESDRGERGRGWGFSFWGGLPGGLDVLLFCYQLSSKVSYLNIFTSNLSFLLVKNAPIGGL